MHGSVAIIGGGVAGLTAAHELIQRGFEVTVYERRAYFGGKAASYRTKQVTDPEVGIAPAAAALVKPWRPAARDEDPGLPGEHGFRFFPGWYRHLTDTMARIPYHKVGGGRRSVADNLVSVRSNLLAWFDRPPIALPLHIPRSVADLAMTSELVAEFSRLGLSPAEVALFWRKLLDVAAMTDRRRVELLEGVSWWDYLECDAPERSEAYVDLVRASTRTSVAAKAEEVSAYTIGRLAIRSLLDTVNQVDRVLNGPTNEVWFEPWIAHLKARGVRFETEMELQSIVFDPENRRVDYIHVEPVPITNVRRLRQLLERNLQTRSVTEDDVVENAKTLIADLSDSPWMQEQVPDWDALASEVLDGPLEDLKRLLASYRERPADEAALEQRDDSRAAVAGALENLLKLLHALEHDAHYPEPVQARHFVLAVPLEQLAYYVDRSTMSTFLAPELRDVVRLSLHMDWMAGIQFYLQEPLDIAPGHVIGLDSPWALTAIEQTQFWTDIILPDNVAAILSVDISAWDKRGRFTKKEAFNCTDDEIAREVWSELKEMLNTRSRAAVISDQMLVGGTALRRGVNYHLDESVVDLRDRHKQAFYERARGVEFDTLDLAATADAEPKRNVTGKTDDVYAWGPKRRFNAEPLLLNRPGSRALRPEACTSIQNLFLAGDYVKTETDLACMEGANEAARRAVNGILDAEAALEPRCDLWPFSPPRQALEVVMAAGGVMSAARGVATAASQLQERVWKRLAIGMMRVQRGSIEPLGPGSDTTLTRR